MQRFLSAGILFVACATGAAAGPIEDAFQRGDYALGVQLLRSLAEQGDVGAQYNLGVQYSIGEGIPQDDQEAGKWQRKAAEQGYFLAQASLGSRYTKGLGVLQDYQEARKWLRKAANQGYGVAQYNLGVMYAAGLGAPPDFITAHMWFNVASTELSGDILKSAMKNRDDVASQMTAAQIVRAQAMAQRCQQSKFKKCDIGGASPEP